MRFTAAFPGPHGRRINAEAGRQLLLAPSSCTAKSPQPITCRFRPWQRVRFQEADNRGPVSDGGLPTASFPGANSRGGNAHTRGEVHLSEAKVHAPAADIVSGCHELVGVSGCLGFLSYQADMARRQRNPALAATSATSVGSVDVRPTRSRDTGGESPVRCSIGSTCRSRSRR